MKVVAIVQARAGSSRLPGKVFLELAGKPVLVHVIDRVSRIEGVDQVVVATTEKASDDSVAELADAAGACTFRGSENDVLSRFAGAAERHDADVIVRITADCPLIDPLVSASVIDYFMGHPVDYASNIKPPTFPDGLDTEVFSREVLDRACREATLQSHREHVTPYLWRTGLFQVGNVTNATDLSYLRWTLDGAEDWEMLQALAAVLGGELATANMTKLLQVIAEHPEIPRINGAGVRNESMERQFQTESVSPDQA